jgi:heme-degrading monooxygenase HmoA
VQEHIPAAVFIVVWEYEVKAGCEERFREAYGSEGAWAELFRRTPGFLMVELVRSVQHPARFFTFDHWSSADVFRDFCMTHAAAYEALDTRMAGLTEWERRIGAFPSE